MDLFAELVGLASALEDAALEYAICGAVALAVHGAPRATKDIDLLAREEDLPRLRELVRARGFTIEALPMTFASGISIYRFTKVESDGRTLMLDVVIPSAALEEVWRTRMKVDLGGTPPRELCVVSREGLISLKLAAGRPQDIVDIQKLEELAHDPHER